MEFLGLLDYLCVDLAQDLCIYKIFFGISQDSSVENLTNRDINTRQTCSSLLQVACSFRIKGVNLDYTSISNLHKHLDFYIEISSILITTSTSFLDLLVISENKPSSDKVVSKQRDGGDWFSHDAPAKTASPKSTPNKKGMFNCTVSLKVYKFL